MAVFHEHLAPKQDEVGCHAEMSKPGNVDRVLESVLVFTISASLLGLATALAGVFYAPQVLIGALLLTGWHVYRARTWVLWPSPAPHWRHLALLLLVTLFFRVPAYNYVMGGQDEGLYTNIAQYIEHTGGIRVEDRIKQQLQGSPFLATYVQDNYYMPGDFVAGVYARDSSGSIQFQFYYLFSVWMALFAGLFGSVAGVYALTLFAALSVLFLYRLALLLTRSSAAALMAGLLLALNPLHAFFSKFPVTEVPALTFSLMGFVLLAAYWSAQADQRQGRWLILSILAFLCLFVTRISGFMYVPFFTLLAVASLALDSEPGRRLAMQRWTLGVVFVYLLSVAYGLIFSRHYSVDIYWLSFKPVLGVHWKGALAALSAAGLLGWATFAVRTLKPHSHRLTTVRLKEWCAWLPGLGVLAALLIGLIKIYRLGWTTRYATRALAERWHLAGNGWHAAAAASLWSLVIYLGPPLALALLLALLRRQADPRTAFLRWFVTGFFIYLATLQWVLPYEPYYARYLLSEFVPYGILLVICTWVEVRSAPARVALTGVLFFSLVYAGILSVAQIGKNEQAGAYASLARLVEPTGQADLLLLQRSVDPSGSLKTPLMYTFHRTVMDVQDKSLADSAYLMKLDSLYDKVFLISPAPTAPDGFTQVERVRLKIMSYRHDHLFPRKLVVAGDTPLYLYLLGNLPLPLDSMQAFSPATPWLEWFHSGWSHPEPWGIWSEGRRSELDIDPQRLPDASGLVLEFKALVFVTPSHPTQRVDVSIDGSNLHHYAVQYPASELIMRVPIPKRLLALQQHIRIDFDLPDAISPQAAGVNPDPRQLALGLEGVTALLDSTGAVAPSKIPADSEH